ncbi:hypothetical protein DVA81_18485, partial [Acinetobacter baumannii]
EGKSFQNHSKTAALVFKAPENLLPKLKYVSIIFDVHELVNFILVGGNMQHPLPTDVKPVKMHSCRTPAAVMCVYVPLLQEHMQ